MDDLAIRTEGLSKQYRGPFFRLRPQAAIDQIDLRVPRGVVFGFLGPNGAGKTTTIRCLMDLIRPTGGRAWVLGTPCGDVAIRQRIGYLPDNPAFSPHLTAWRFLGLCAKLLRIASDQRRERIREALEVVSMSEHAHQRLGEFSRGMIQRIGIAQAILNRPDLLILDEPLVGLDPHGRKDLLDIVLQQKKRGACVFFCSHILSDVEKLCDQVGILSRGKLLCAGSLDDLLGAKGMQVTIPAAHEALARELTLQADDTHHLDGGGWRLTFANGQRAEALQERSWPEDVQVQPFREGLEECFFRLTRQDSRHD